MAIPLRSPGAHQRLQSNTRMDVLSSFGSNSTYIPARTSPMSTYNKAVPRDSLSPCDEYFRKPLPEAETCIREVQENAQDHGATAAPDGSGNMQVHMQVGLTQTKQERSCTAERCQQRQTTPSHEALQQQEACPPRFRQARLQRPPDLFIESDYGRTIAPVNVLKRCIRSARSSDSTCRTIDYQKKPSPPPKARKKLPKTAPQPLSPPKDCGRSNAREMGNSHSHHAGFDDSALGDDSGSLRSVVRSPRLSKLPRRSSYNVFKRLDSKSPLPADFTAAVIEVPRAATAPNLDGMADDDTDDGEDNPARGRARHAHRHSAPSPALLVQSASHATLTEELAARPTSAADTITNHHEYNEDMGNTESSPTHLRVSALSPTLPSPSPLPEDSPHKYGLRDRMDTPDQPSPPPELKVQKAKRRSSGLEIFNQATNLQSASSFLNGLSTARRRAESRAQSRAGNTTDATLASANTTSTFPSFSQFPLSSGPSTAQLYASTTQLNPSLAQLDIDAAAAIDIEEDFLARNRGHTTKASGYAYARPLGITQLKCFRAHAKLLPSRNKHAPVECGVCHADDEKDHFTCSWCALRMCGTCRREFQERGELALRERVRMAEGGRASDYDLSGMIGRSSQAAIRAYG